MDQHHTITTPGHPSAIHNTLKEQGVRPFECVVCCDRLSKYEVHKRPSDPLDRLYCEECV